MTTKDSQTKRLDSSIWTRANPYIAEVMRTLRAKRGGLTGLNAAGKAYDKFAWWHALRAGGLYVPLAHYRSVKPMVAAQMRRMGFSPSYIDGYLDHEGPYLAGSDLRDVVEQRFFDALNASSDRGDGDQ